MNRTRIPAALLAGSVFALAALRAAAGADDAGKVRLRLGLEQGKAYAMATVVEQKIDQDIQGRKVATSQRIGTDYTFEVQEVKRDGAMRAKVTYQRVRMEQDGPMGKVDYDSANPPEKVHALAQGAASLVGQSVTMELMPDGRITRLEGMDALFKRMLDGMEFPPGVPKATMEEQLKRQFGDKAMRSSMEQLTAIYPEKPVAVGESWTRKARASVGFPMQVETTYTLKARKDGTALVGLKSKVAGDPKADPMKMGPLSMAFDVSGSQEGEMELDEATGWTKRAKITQDLSGKVKVEGMPGQTEAMSWPITIQGTVAVEPPKK